MKNFVIFTAEERSRYVPKEKKARFMKFSQGMQVRYTGDTLTKRFPEDMKSKIGEVVSKVGGDTDALVVEFGSKSFIVDPTSLVEYVPKEKNTGPEIMKLLRKWEVSEGD